MRTRKEKITAALAALTFTVMTHAPHAVGDPTRAPHPGPGPQVPQGPVAHQPIPQQPPVQHAPPPAPPPAQHQTPAPPPIQHSQAPAPPPVQHPPPPAPPPIQHSQAPAPPPIEHTPQPPAGPAHSQSPVPQAPGRTDEPPVHSPPPPNHPEPGPTVAHPPPPGGFPSTHPTEPVQHPNGPTRPVPPAPPVRNMPPPERVAVARQAAPVTVNVINPTPPPAGFNLNERITTVARTNINQTVVVNNTTLIRPQRWGYMGYEDRTPYFYNPYRGPVYVRYFYGGAYRMLAVAAGARMLIDGIAAAGVYPYTVVGDDFVSSGYFNGDGYAPPEYENVTATLPAYGGQQVLVDKVTDIGHDDSRPPGQQDSFMLNGNELAWGTKDDPSHITIERTQPTPGVGPVSDGGDLVTPMAKEDTAADHTGLWVGFAVGLGILGGASILAWRWRERHRNAGLQRSAAGPPRLDDLDH